ncbi:hypothetical protein BACEGG_01358 [Bacteroides eggerthii DSM 20697]|nr:hypothetical protein BACEGG_01358 [Bacteroides eggerthii DSM 20697]
MVYLFILVSQTVSPAVSALLVMRWLIERKLFHLLFHKLFHFYVIIYD